MIQPNLQAFNPCIFKCTSTSCKKLATTICPMSRQLSLTIFFSRKKLIIKSRASVSRKIRNLRKRRILSSLLATIAMMKSRLTVLITTLKMKTIYSNLMLILTSTFWRSSSQTSRKIGNCKSKLEITSRSSARVELRAGRMLSTNVLLNSTTFQSIL